MGLLAKYITQHILGLLAPRYRLVYVLRLALLIKLTSRNQPDIGSSIYTLVDNLPSNTCLGYHMNRCNRPSSSTFPSSAFQTYGFARNM